MPLSTLSSDEDCSTPQRSPTDGSEPPVRVVIAHPIALLRMGLVELVRGQDRAVLVACESSERELAAALRRHRPGVAIIAPEFQASASAGAHPPRLLLVSQHDHAGDASDSTHACAFAGARTSIDSLVDTLRRMASCVHLHEAPRPCPRCPLQRSLAPGPLPLSPREQQVFELIGSGGITGEIAQQMGLSIKTVETYRANIKFKLGLDSSAALTGAATLWRKGIHPLRLGT